MSDIASTPKIMPKSTGRPKGTQDSVEREKVKILKQLKRIWNDPNAKASDIIASASLFADITGQKAKYGTINAKDGQVMRIEFGTEIFDDTTPPTPPTETVSTLKPIIDDSSNVITPTDSNIITKMPNEIANKMIVEPPMIKNSNIFEFNDKRTKEIKDSKKRINSVIAKLFPEEPEEDAQQDSQVEQVQDISNIADTIDDDPFK